MIVNGNIILNMDASGEIRNAYIERVTSQTESDMVPTLSKAHAGRLIYNLDTARFRVWTGSTFVDLSTADDVTMKASQLDVSNIITSTGLQYNGTLDPFTTTSFLNGVTTYRDALTVLDLTLRSQVNDLVSTINKMHHVESFTNTGSTSSITVVHNLGQKYCQVVCADSGDMMISPDSVFYQDDNTLIVTLATDLSGVVIVTGHVDYVPQ